MLTIYKYEFSVNDTIEIPMPFGAKILHVECQRGRPCMWALVETQRTESPRRFSIYGTGQEIPRGLDGFGVPAGEFVATFQQGPLVWHVFERRGE